MGCIKSKIVNLEVKDTWVLSVVNLGIGVCARLVFGCDREPRTLVCVQPDGGGE